MKVALGKAVYAEGKQPCSGLGLKWTDQECDSALDGRVAGVLFDDEGKADIEEMLRGTIETGFEEASLRRILADPGSIENWRVGEAIAETWLTDHRDCTFPWPDGRDERKHGSSLPGADLVGLCADAKGDRLTLGEVKTTSDARYPPRLMYGRTGLKQQLEGLCFKTPIRDRLFKYLAHRSHRAIWMSRFRCAAKRYLINKSDVQLFGFLVRDVPPHRDDVRARVESLGQDLPEGMRIELLALYLPSGRINGLGAATIAANEGAAS